MSFDATDIFLSLITGGVGFVLLVYGKKQGRWPFIVAGLAYMAYPYLVSGLAADLGVGIAIGVGLWLAVREGW
jgi:hypothetical protein